MQEDYDGKIREAHASLANEQQHKEELEKSLEDHTTILNDLQKSHEQTVE